jgi:adenylosuccinate synthase
MKQEHKQGYIDVVGGSQFGDEGKGKVVDQMGEQASIGARTNGADNAGHTVDVNGKTYIMHLVPSSIINDHMISIIGNGVLINPKQLLKEIYQLRDAGLKIDAHKLMISDKAFVTFPHHKYIDVIKDSIRRHPIGTTGSGVGPAYAGQMYRTGLRVQDLFNVETLREALLDDKEEFDQYAKAFVPKLKQRVKDGKYSGSKLEDIKLFLSERIIEYYDEETGLKVDKIVEDYYKMGQELKPHVIDTRTFVLENLNLGKNVIVELAQGAGLDKDQGTYPYVTASNCGTVSVETGLGIPRKFIRNYVAVVKLVPSRVGEGPFVGEYGEYSDIRGKTRKELGLNRKDNSLILEKINNGTATPFEIGQYFRNVGVNDDKTNGGEYGATTARPRRIGMLDLTLVKEHNEKFGFTHLAFTKLDVYDGIKTIHVLVDDEHNGKKIISLPGFNNTYGKTSFKDIETNAQNFIHFISEYTGLPVNTIATGPRREQVITDYVSR